MSTLEVVRLPKYNKKKKLLKIQKCLTIFHTLCTNSLLSTLLVYYINYIIEIY